MNRHQVLTGASNSSSTAFSCGSVEGINFTAYGSGCDLVILNDAFERVQIFPGANYGNVQIGCVECCIDIGKITASYGNKVQVFEPTPLLQHHSAHKLDYKWYRTGCISTDFYITALSCNTDGTRMLVGGEKLEMYQWQDKHHGGPTGSNSGVSFHIGDDTPSVQPGKTDGSDAFGWELIWFHRPASIVYHLSFSPDGLLFASAGKTDSLVKVWFENKQGEHPGAAGRHDAPRRDDLAFSFTYLPHPRAVSGFSWRATSKYMHRGIVPHMLTTSCGDNLCRVWCETVVPDCHLVDTQHFERTKNSRFHVSRHKHRFMQKLRHIRHSMHHRRQKRLFNSKSMHRIATTMARSPSFTLSSSHSSMSVHDFHRFAWVAGEGFGPSTHFHLSAVISPETDIPLLPSTGHSYSGGYEGAFVVHWLNNKEMRFTLEAERLLASFTAPHSSSAQDNNGASGQGSGPDSATGSGRGTPLVTSDSDHHDSGKEDHHLHREDSKKKREFLRRHSSKKKHVTLSVGPQEEGENHHLSTSPSHPSLSTDEGGSSQQHDPLDSKIELLLEEWHSASDMLFCIHPTDGSLLIWRVEWLDEYLPGSFRQAQVCFASRIPHAIPTFDARGMAPHVSTFCTHPHLDIKSAEADEKQRAGHEGPGDNNSASERGDSSLVTMVTKQADGTLNQWQLRFADDSHFCTVLSIQHEQRACGHRFRTNHVASHPALPLLLTTSHHNVADVDFVSPSKQQMPEALHIPEQILQDFPESQGFCSELILWRVHTVGPLSRSGGITELARMSSPQLAAFSDVAFLPTLLPSTALGEANDSPSALFIASDGEGLRLYQALIDARILLSASASADDIATASSQQTSPVWTPSSEGSEEGSVRQLQIMSQQSTATPGCIIALDTITGAVKDWTHMELTHVFQEQLVTGQRSGGQHFSAEPMVNLQHLANFQEHFFLLVLERSGAKSVVHMWRIVISSKPPDESMAYSPDAVLTQDDDGMSSPDTEDAEPRKHIDWGTPNLDVFTTKVCEQALPLPEGVTVQCATIAAGHLSSSSIYPACFAPYLFATACSDGTTRFWSVEHGQEGGEETFNWREWEMLLPSDEGSLIRVPGQPITVRCAYSGRVAVAYRQGDIKPQVGRPDKKLFHLCVSVFECESTGGSCWTLEDNIELRNIVIPDPKAEIDLSVIYGDGARRSQLSALEHSGEERSISPSPSFSKLVRNVSIPSFSTIHSVRRVISGQGNKSGILKQKFLVQLDWVSAEDGAHVLTVAVGTKLLLYTAVSSEVAQRCSSHHLVRDKGVSASGARPALQRMQTITVPNTVVGELRWLRLRSVNFSTADSLPPLPMHVSWVRNGILVVGMDNEMHVYTQWPGESELGGVEEEEEEEQGARVLRQAYIKRHSDVERKMKYSASTPALKRLLTHATLIPTESSRRNEGASEKIPKEPGMASGLSWSEDFGLFEAARLSNNVLPQYHPKQLLELLNFGRIRRVKAILAHLVRCIASESEGGEPHVTRARDDEDTGGEVRQQLVRRRMSVALPALSQDSSSPHLRDETSPAFLQIASVPPLPIYALLSADNPGGASGGVGVGGGNPCAGDVQGEEGQADSYNDLFNAAPGDDLADGVNFSVVDADDAMPGGKSPQEKSVSWHLKVASSANLFDTQQARQLTNQLTHTQLPGLSSLDQMYLLAVADTIASTCLEFTAHDSDNSIKEAVDDCGLRFLLGMRHYVHLVNTLPPRQRQALQVKGLSSSVYVWAFHSDATEELLSNVPGIQRGEPSWADLKNVGAGWWIRSDTLLRRTLEKVAKAAFTATKNPLDAALFYCAMKKKAVVWGLFRSVDDKRMAEFFKRDFTQERWHKAALKNAFALLARQRFEHAAAFFLLAGSLNEAVEVLVRRLEDLQLAMVVVRLYSTDNDASSPSLFTNLLLQSEVLGQKLGKPHADPFLRSMALWALGDRQGALKTLLTQSSVAGGRQEDEMAAYTAHTSVFNFYNYLRTHPLLVRQQVIGKDVQEGSLLTTVTSAGRTDAITPAERQLYFQTAHAHFKAGCPLLALEVLTKLPQVVIVPPPPEEDINKEEEKKEEVKAEDPAPSSTSGDVHVDWGASSLTNGSALDMDWGASSFKIEDDGPPTFAISDSEEDDNSSGPSDGGGGGGAEEAAEAEGPTLKQLVDGAGRGAEAPPPGDGGDEKAKGGEQDAGGATVLGWDIMAQQLKFIACLRIMMEELSTLATGFEVDGGQLRYQLYIWLEQEVGALSKLCDYGTAAHTADQSLAGTMSDWVDEADRQRRRTLHEILIAEKTDFENKLRRLSRRKTWLKANQQLLQTLLSYCSLHGGSGGGLASVKMELVLLLQELQQERATQQLHSPLPFPTTLPLLSAAITSCKTYVADPISHLYRLTKDIRESVVRHRLSPSADHPVFQVELVRTLAAALSSCVYQCLCDSDSFKPPAAQHPDVGLEGFTSTHVVYQNTFLMGGLRTRHRSSSGEAAQLANMSHPSKWPGVASLSALVARKRDPARPSLLHMLAEILLSVFASLLMHALATYDCCMLFRLISKPLDEVMWGRLYGGGMKRLLRVANRAGNTPALSSSPQQGGGAGDRLAQQRANLNLRVLGARGGGPTTMQEGRPTYREHFRPPECSVVSYFMTKPETVPDGVEYDSEASESSDEDDEYIDEDDPYNQYRRSQTTNKEHLDPNSYSWRIMRLAALRLIVSRIHAFLPLVDLQTADLATMSPHIHAVVTTLESWQRQAVKALEAAPPPPDNYIPGCFVDASARGPAILKYRTMLDPANTPFPEQRSAQPARRLWLALVNMEAVQSVFIKYIFRSHDERSGRGEDEVDYSAPASSSSSSPASSTRVIHKDQDGIACFCFSQGVHGQQRLALATQREVQELEISALLSPPTWLQDQTDYDIETISTGEGPVSSDFLLVSAPQDHLSSSPANISRHAGSSAAQQTGRGTVLLAKRPSGGVRRMAAHPTLPYYMTGSQDGRTELWEWGRHEPLFCPRQAGTAPKPTRILFSPQGNKFGVSDHEGSLSLWQLANLNAPADPFITLECHNKTCSDFTFLGSSSYVATAGHSTENMNVCLWDTLLPKHSSLVQGFSCHEHGSPALVYAPRHQLLVSAGRKGDVCVFDLRQRQLMTSFQAHDNAIKCLALHPSEEFFATGCSDGHIKLWGLGYHQQLASLTGEHTKSTFFRQLGNGVLQVSLLPGPSAEHSCHVMSCGADGSLRLRTVTNLTPHGPNS